MIPERDRRYFYDTIAEQFDETMNPYDVGRRLEIVYEELLSTTELVDKHVLDVGAGTGRFTEAAVRAGAHVTATDIGVNLLVRTRSRTRAALFASDACALALKSSSFDIVVSSECIEHTPDPLAAVREMCRVLRRPGVLVVTTPNRLWHLSAIVAERFNLRPYRGFENWVGWRELQATVAAEGLTVVDIRGFHLVPPLFKSLWAPLRRIDRLGSVIGPVMLNVALRAEKQ